MGDRVLSSSALKVSGLSGLGLLDAMLTPSLESPKSIGDENKGDFPPDMARWKTDVVMECGELPSLF